jgi:peptide/nickel transport system substrate-binding protein
MRKPQALACMLAIACTAALLSACGGSSGGGGTAVATDGTFTYALAGDPGTLDPNKAVGDQALTVFAFTYDTLVATGPDGRTVPALATKWTAKPAEVTFTLRSGVTCADGSPVTATTVKQNLDAIKDPKNKSVQLGLVMPDPGYTVRADDQAGTVTIKLSHPFGLLVDSLRYMPVVCGKGLKDPSVLAHQTSGSGPFVLTQGVSNDHYTLTRRDGYKWGPRGATTAVAGMPKTVVLKVVENESTAANLLLSGSLSGALVSGPDRKRLEGTGLKPMLRTSGVAAAVFNQAKGRPGADPAVRKALAMAIDRSQIAHVYNGGSATAATGFLSGGAVCTEPGVVAAAPQFDATGAAAALQAAGWQPGPGGIRVKDGKRLTLKAPYLTSVPGTSESIELIRQAWQKAGAELKPEGMATAAMNQVLFGGGDWDAAPLLSIGVPLPTALVGLYAGPPPPKGGNFAAVNNPQFGQLAGQAVPVPGQAACPIWGKAESALTSRADSVPVVAQQSSTFASSKARFQITSYNTVIPTSIRVLK